jgi:hypothetical protein
MTIKQTIKQIIKLNKYTKESVFVILINNSNNKNIKSFRTNEKNLSEDLKYIEEYQNLKIDYFTLLCDPLTSDNKLEIKVLNEELKKLNN